MTQIQPYHMLISGMLIPVSKHVFRVLAIHSEVYQGSLNKPNDTLIVQVIQKPAKHKKCPLNFADCIDFLEIDGKLCAGENIIIADMTKPIDFWKNRRS
jgi:hypothetical protein